MNKQVYHAVNIVRMVSALQKTLTCHTHVPIARQQFPYLKAKPFFLLMTMSESGQLNAAPSGILIPWNLITKPAIERYRPVMRGSTDGCLPPSARRGFIAARSARRVRQNARP